MNYEACSENKALYEKPESSGSESGSSSTFNVSKSWFENFKTR